MKELLHRALGGSRYVVIVAVVSTLISAMALLVYGALMELAALIRAVRDGPISS